MKKSELRKLIREEIEKLNETKTIVANFNKTNPTSEEKLSFIFAEQILSNLIPGNIYKLHDLFNSEEYKDDGFYVDEGKAIKIFKSLPKYFDIKDIDSGEKYTIVKMGSTNFKVIKGE